MSTYFLKMYTLHIEMNNKQFKQKKQKLIPERQASGPCIVPGLFRGTGSAPDGKVITTCEAVIREKLARF